MIGEKLEDGGDASAPVEYGDDQRFMEDGAINGGVTSEGTAAEEASSEESIKKRQVGRAMRAFEEVYNPSSLEISKSMYPFFREYGSRAGSILRLGRQIEEDPVRGAERAKDFFCEVFGIDKNVDIRVYIADADDPLGEYDDSSDTAMVYLRKNDSPGQLLATVAHEVCHAYQQREMYKDTEKARIYRINMRYYCRDNWDYESYASQYTEREALLIDGYVQSDFWCKYFREYPRERGRYKRILQLVRDGKYNIEENPDNLDLVALEIIKRGLDNDAVNKVDNVAWAVHDKIVEVINVFQGDIEKKFAAARRKVCRKLGSVANELAVELDDYGR